MAIMTERTRVKYLTSTKAKLLEESVNKELNELEKDGYTIKSIKSNLSYTGDKGSMAYMILCQIIYTKEVEYDVVPKYDIGIGFGTGMSFDDCPSR